jgi:hypothetical protein
MVRCERLWAKVALVTFVGAWAASVGQVAACADADPTAGAFSIPLAIDTGGHPLDGSDGRYTLTFGPGRLPPVKAFWSLTMYSLPDQLLVANPIGRYLINSPMLADLQRDADGGLTLYIQNDAPGGEQDANWLPAPDGPFLMILRLYRPEQSVLDNDWEAPGVVRVE